MQQDSVQFNSAEFKPNNPNMEKGQSNELSQLSKVETGSVSAPKSSPPPTAGGASSSKPTNGGLSDNSHDESKSQQPTKFENDISKISAGDTDTIEEDWVDKADEIIDKTSNDPYYEDEAQHSLSRAYLKNRFNLDVE